MFLNSASFDFSADPLFSFEKELQKAGEMGVKEPNAMCLSTVSADGIPSSRTVLFKGLTRGGVTFFTNYESQKSQDLGVNNGASALFFWASLEQQVCFRGPAFKVTRQESEEYFKTRPRLSQIGAWASLQSQKIPDKDFLERRVLEYEKQFEGQEIPCPPNWGGWRLVPFHIEFWFGRGGRLHERYVFERELRPAHDFSDSTPWRRFIKSP